MDDRRILGLDLGTSTGWAIWCDGGVASGVWVLASPRELAAQRRAGRDRTCDIRFTRLLRRLRETVVKCGLVSIAFEDVRFHSSLAQTQLWAGLRSAIWAVASDAGIAVDCVPTATLKKFATGRGDAGKEAMAAALAALPPTWARRPATHDEVDALWVLRWAISRRDPAAAGSVPAAAGTRSWPAT